MASIYTKSAQKQNLSKNIMGMKFMRRTALNVEKEQNEEDTKRQIDDEHWVLDIPELKEKESEYEKEESYAACHDFIFGRVSFQNFNPDIEKLAASKVAAQKEAESEKRVKEVEVDEDEMANRYAQLIGTIAKKFNKDHKGKSKKHPKPSNGVQKTGKKTKHKHSKERHFLKPSDD